MRATRGTAYQEGWRWGNSVARGVEHYTPFTEQKLVALKMTDPAWVDGYRLGLASGKVQALPNATASPTPAAATGSGVVGRAWAEFCRSCRGDGSLVDRRRAGAVAGGSGGDVAASR